MTYLILLLALVVNTLSTTLFLATINSGDEVIIPAPYWVSYPDIVLLNSGKPVIVECGESSGFKLLPEDLEKNISSKTKWLMLNSPSNPTGSMYTKEELMALGEVLKNMIMFMFYQMISMKRLSTMETLFIL